MRAIRRSISLVAVAVAVGVLGAAPAAAERPNLVPGSPVQLSLGDSWAFGFGATVPTEGGYVPQLHEALKEQYGCLPAEAPEARDHCKQLQLINLAVGGATTPTLIANQLPTASELLGSRNGDSNPRNDVEVVTLHIGGNDIFNPIIAACLSGISPQCLETIETVFAAYRSNLSQALSALREAAGADARIVIGTYDNPIATCFLGGVPGAIALGDLVLEGDPPGVLPESFHDIIRDVASEYNIEVAEVYGTLGSQDWVGGGDCLHPDDSGYDKVTDAFLGVLVPTG